MGMLYRRKKGGLETGPWWMKYYDHGRPIYQSTEKYEKRQAEAVLKRAEGKVAEGQHEGNYIQRTKFEDLIEGLRQDYILKGRKSWDRRQLSLDHLQRMFLGMKVKSITTDTLQSYVTSRLEQGAATASVNRDLDCLRRMLTIGQQKMPPTVGKIPKFPTLKESPPREGFLEHDEFLAIRGAAPNHVKVAMTIAYYTGMRLREIISKKGLRWEQIDLGEGSIRLSSTQTKTSKARVIYMSGEFLAAMKKIREKHLLTYPNCPFVCHRLGKPFWELRMGWIRACQRVGIEGKTFHDLRRTAIRNLVRSGVSERVVMAISGHKTRSVFDRYNITSDNDLQEAAAKLAQHMAKKKGDTYGDTLVADSSKLVGKIDE